jgi:hypothetical protein
VQPTLEAGEQDTERALARLAKQGIDLGAITEKLVADGITAFNYSLDELLASLKEKRRVMLERRAGRKGGIRTTRIAWIRRGCKNSGGINATQTRPLVCVTDCRISY